MSQELEHPFPSISEADIVAIESKIGVGFPQVYRSFLLTYNGGYPKRNAFEYVWRHSLTRHSAVKCFLGIATGELHSIENFSTIYGGRIPNNLLPIAPTEIGDVICISITGQDAGKIYLWKHEEEHDYEVSSVYDNVYSVANDFTEFLNSLRE